MGYNSSGLPSTIIVLGLSLYSVLLEIGTGVPLEPMGSSRHWALKTLRPVDKEAEGGKDGQGMSFKPQVRKRCEAFDIVEVSFEEGMQSVEPSEVPNVVLEAVEGSGSFNATFFLRGIFKLFKEGMVRKLGFDSLKAFTSLAGVLSSPVKDMAAPYPYVEVVLLLSLQHFLEVRLYHTICCYFSFYNSYWFI